MKEQGIIYQMNGKKQILGKHILHIFASTALLYVVFTLTGCTFEEVLDKRAVESDIEEKLIEFDARVQGDSLQTGQTRAEMVEYDTFITQDIALTASFTGTGTNGTNDYFSAERMAFNNGWVTDRKYYWPLEKLNFRARMPYNDSAVTDETSTGFTYTVPRSANDQHDMLYATTYNVEREDSVHMYFLHSMASVSFKAMKKDASVNGVVAGITIESVPRKATFLYPTANTTNQPGSPVCTLNVTEWGPVDAGIFETELTPDETLITDIGGELLLLPGTIDSRLVISCRISDTGLYLAGSDHTFGTIYAPFSGITLEAGKHYTFLLQFGVGQDENGNVNQLQVTMGYYITPWGKEVINFDKQLL